MVGEVQPKSEVSQALSFEEVRGKVEAYLGNPKSGDPYDLVNQYFFAAKASSEWSHTREEAEALLSLMEKTMSRSIDPIKNIEHGTSGTIAPRLPYFYSLNLLVLTHFVFGEVDSVISADKEIRERLIGELSLKVVTYDPFRHDVSTNISYIKRALLPQPAYAK